jgi:hypothetical protein
MRRALLALCFLALVAPLAAPSTLPSDEVVRGLPASKLFVPVGAQPCMDGSPEGPVTAAWDFEDGAQGWSLVSTPNRPNLWHATTFKGNGSAIDAEGHGGPGRLYYGNENAFGGTYNTSRMRNQGEFRSPLVTVPQGVSAIRLNTKWHVEWDSAWSIDSMQLGYDNAAGQRTMLCTFGNTFAVATNLVIGWGYYQTSPYGKAIFTGCEYSLESPQNPCRAAQDFAHQDITFDLAPEIAAWEQRWVLLPPELAGQSIRVSVYFQTGDAIVDDAMGWMVDDVAVVQLHA